MKYLSSGPSILLKIKQLEKILLDRQHVRRRSVPDCDQKKKTSRYIATIQRDSQLSTCLSDLFGKAAEVTGSWAT